MRVDVVSQYLCKSTHNHLMREARRRHVVELTVDKLGSRPIGQVPVIVGSMLGGSGIGINFWKRHMAPAFNMSLSCSDSIPELESEEPPYTRNPTIWVRHE